ncbi:CoA ester lyase [Pseudohalioglobus sediminis]|uniref:CoA ester lyase n=1 Tax=Pseudohalioglobus sediminis TaxID=2606449 RepID=A0A5B0X4U5_9GAMM|nr:CoA ester lyase [Pseudohalioglobus sediminis]KAA1194252.1 CoA ester lyase [Pseudohalioglobus sediminis]
MPAPSPYRPRRSCLFMPGANARALEKAQSLPADTLILDLEDAVAPDAKAGARAAVLAAVSERRFGSREVLIRVNSLDSPWGRDDLAMAVSAAPDGIVVPKVTCAEQVEKLDNALSKAGAATDLALWLMVEMPRAVLDIRDIAAVAGSTRLRGFILGLNDLALETHAVATADRVAFQYVLSAVVLAARAHGLLAIDSVYNDFRDEAGLAQQCEQARVLGFDGKSLIHPAQLEVANRVFSPHPEAVSHARAVIQAFSLPENSGKGVIQVNGKMTELLHLQEAQRLVAISEAIAQSTTGG